MSPKDAEPTENAKPQSKEQAGNSVPRVSLNDLWAHLRSMAGRGLAAVRRSLSSAGRAFGQLGSEFRLTWEFYSTNGELFTDYVRDLIGSSISRAEIKLRREHESAQFEWNHQNWSLQLPDCCVVCGDSTDRNWIDEESSVLDIRPAIFLPVIAFVLSLIAFGAGFPWLIVFIAPLAACMFARNACVELPGRIRYRRCTEHLGKTAYPDVRAFRLHHDTLIVRVGRRSVMNAYFESVRESAGKHAGKRPPKPQFAESPPKKTAEPTPQRTTIPLSDTPAAPVEPEAAEEPDDTILLQDLPEPESVTSVDTSETADQAELVDNDEEDDSDADVLEVLPFDDSDDDETLDSDVFEDDTAAGDAEEFDEDEIVSIDDADLIFEEPDDDSSANDDPADEDPVDEHLAADETPAESDEAEPPAQPVANSETVPVSSPDPAGDDSGPQTTHLITMWEVPVDLRPNGGDIEEFLAMCATAIMNALGHQISDLGLDITPLERQVTCGCNDFSITFDLTFDRSTDVQLVAAEMAKASDDFINTLRSQGVPSFLNDYRAYKAAGN